MKFPNLVYISPGDHQCPGGTFSYRRVACEDDVEGAAKAGYYPTIELAVSKPSDFDWGEYLGYPAASPSRAELEMRASFHGIEFTDKTRDSTLVKKIAEAEAGHTE